MMWPVHVLCRLHEEIYNFCDWIRPAHHEVQLRFDVFAKVKCACETFFAMQEPPVKVQVSEYWGWGVGWQNDGL